MFDFRNIFDYRDFDIEGSWNCRYDYLEIRDGDNENSTVIGKYCGDSSVTPDTITSNYNYIFINFVTDGSVQNRGFVMNYTTIQVRCRMAIFLYQVCINLYLL